MGETVASGFSPETAGDSLFNIPRLVSRNMYYRTVVVSALIRLLRLVTLARFNGALVFAVVLADRHHLSRFHLDCLTRAANNRFQGRTCSKNSGCGANTVSLFAP